MSVLAKVDATGGFFEWFGASVVVGWEGFVCSVFFFEVWLVARGESGKVGSVVFTRGGGEDSWVPLADRLNRSRHLLVVVAEAVPQWSWEWKRCSWAVGGIGLDER